MADINISILEDIGLTKAQIKVYLALLETGETTSGPIIKKSELQNSVVYNALNHLIEEGLVSFIFRGKTKYFQAADPKNLVTYIETKKKRLLDILPQLTKKKEKRPNEATVFVGWKGIYAAFNSILEELPAGSEYIGFAAGADEQFSEETKTFFGIYNRKRSEMKYHIKLIANESARKTIRKYKYEKGQRKPQYRFVKGIAFNGIIIFGDKVLQVAFEDEPVAVIISSKAMADSFRQVFNSYWKTAKP
jgi:HTH-type transcriptional regulator, sugar sensing transcriptional regulator